jgi:hypothetical protein
MRTCTVWDPALDEGPADYAGYAFESRVLRPLTWFGLFETRLVGDESAPAWRRDRQYRKTPLSDQALRFNVQLAKPAGPHTDSAAKFSPLSPCGYAQKFQQIVVFFAMSVSTFLMYTHGANGWEMADAVTLLRGAVIGYVTGEMWVSCLLQGELKCWAWLPMVRRKWRKQVA